MRVVLVWVAERGFPRLLRRPLPFLLEGVLAVFEAGVNGLREAGVRGMEWEKVLAWALILERRWVMALGVTSVGIEC
jgi:hypothetical protein